MVFSPQRRAARCAQRGLSHLVPLPCGPEVGRRHQACPHLSFLCPSQALPFSHLILATGSTGPFPGKFNQVSSQQVAIQLYEDMVTQVSCALTRWGSEGRPGGPPGRVEQLW